MIRPEVMAWAWEMEEMLRLHDPEYGDSWKEAALGDLVSAHEHAMQSLAKANTPDKLWEQLVDVSVLAMMRHYRESPPAAIPEGLTQTMTRVYRYIFSHIAEKGYAPSYRSIAKECRLNSPSSVMDVLRRMRDRGVIDFTNKRNSIRITK